MSDVITVSPGRIMRVAVGIHIPPVLCGIARGPALCSIARGNNHSSCDVTSNIPDMTSLVKCPLGMSLICTIQGVARFHSFFVFFLFIYFFVIFFI